MTFLPLYQIDAALRVITEDHILESEGYVSLNINDEMKNCLPTTTDSIKTLSFVYYIKLMCTPCHTRALNNRAIEQ